MGQFIKTNRWAETLKHLSICHWIHKPLTQEFIYNNHQAMSSKEKSTKRGFGIIAISKKKKSKKKTSGAGVDDRKASVGSDSVTEIETVDFAGSEGGAMEEEVAELTKQLEDARTELESAEVKLEKDTERILKLEGELKNSQEQIKTLQEKVGEFEKVSGDLDDESYGAAQEFQLKQQVEKLRSELEKRKSLEHQLVEAKRELQEIKSQYEEIQFKQLQSSTRSKIKSLSDEKVTRDEVFKLQKDLRALDHKLKYEKSTFDAQLKAGQDSLQRAQEKIKAIQMRFDEVEKERLELKISTNRLEKKLEKVGSYAEKKRIQTEQETAELELHNLRRKNAKLEKKLSMSQQVLNTIETGSDIVSDAGDFDRSGRSSAVLSPIPVTLSEARIMNLEREVQQLEMKNSKLVRECEELKDRSVDVGQSSDLLSLKVSQLEEQLTNEKKIVEELEKDTQTRNKAISDLESELEKIASHGSGSGYIQSLQSKIGQLETLVQESETKFRVKEKDLWATIESQKKQIQEIEMEKLKLELGEDEEDLTDVEEEESAEPPFNMRERLMSLQVELESVKTNNDELKSELEKQSAEAEEFLKSVESELESVTPIDGQEVQKQLREKIKEHENALREIKRLQGIISKQEAEGFEDKLKELKKEHGKTLHELEQSKSSAQGLDELKAVLQEKTEQHEKALEEVKHLKEVIAEQVSFITNVVSNGYLKAKFV